MKILNKLILSMMIFLCSVVTSHAQDLAESSLLFSQTFSGGSARIQGLGGAQTALGGDISSAASNPAGLGMFNRSVFSFSPGLSFHNTESSFLDSDTKDSGAKFIIPNIGFVSQKVPRNTSGPIKSYSFGVSINRVNDFNNHFTYANRNSEPTIVDFFLQDAEGSEISQFDADGFNSTSLTALAFDNFLINPKVLNPTDFPDDPDSLTSYFSDAGTIADVRERVSTSGSQNRWSFSAGANYNDNFYFGASIGIIGFNFESEKEYSEEYNIENGSNGVVNRIDIREELEIQGTGFNATIGFIHRPANFLQWGASLVTPSYFVLTESYTASLNSDWDNFLFSTDDPNTPEDELIILNEVQSELDLLLSEYTVSTPLKWNIGATFFLGKNGFITADVGGTNPTKNRLDSEEFNTDFDNENIDFLFQNTIDYRIGAELRHKAMRFRAGYNHMGNSFKDDLGDSSSDAVTFGIGILQKNFHVDFAIVHRTFESLYFPIKEQVVAAPATVVTKNNRINAQVTVGFNF